MIKLKDLILERVRHSEKTHKTQIMTKLVAPIVAKILQKQNLPVVDTVTSKHGWAEDISDFYWDEDRANKLCWINGRIAIAEVSMNLPF